MVLESELFRNYFHVYFIVSQFYIWLHSCRISLSELVVRTASLPLISPPHPLLMFSTDSEPCRMCTETSTRSAALLPGRGSDYIWSINTPWLWEALCLSFSSLSPLPLASLFLTPARLLQDGIWSQSAKQSVFGAIYVSCIICISNVLHPSMQPFVLLT